MSEFSQIQEQKLEQKLGQSISHQQLLQAALVELPVAQLVDRVNTEMNDNPALEVDADYDEPEAMDFQDSSDYGDGGDDYETSSEREERQSALDDALSNIGRDDEDLPVYQGGSAVAEEREEMVYGETVSFYDQLKEQMGELEMTEHQRDVMEYLIGSLDDDGLLRKGLDVICEELAIYHNIDVTEQEVEQVLQLLQHFDPAGIGARTLQECLLLQISRREPSRVRDLMQRVINSYFDEFTKKHWDKIQTALMLNDMQAEALFRELRKLNPRPGASLGETVGRNLQQITPDFIVDTQDDGTVTFVLNNGEVPELKVSQSFADSMKEYQENKENLSRQTKEALLYIKKKVDAAQSFIEAIKVRRHTLTVTFPLRYFFSDGYVTESGEELSTRQIKATLRDIIDAEDKKHPLSDDVIKEELAKRGFPIARRTVAKYREQLGIPIARLRK